MDNIQHMFNPYGGKGIKTYGKRALVTILNKYKQLHNLTFFGPQDPAIVSQQE